MLLSWATTGYRMKGWCNPSAAGMLPALAALYDRYAPRVHAVALLIIREADAAATVVEAVFWECWRGGGPAADGRSVGHSLTLAARRMAGAHGRRPASKPKTGRAD